MGTTRVVPARVTARPAVLRTRPGWPLAVIFLGFPVWWLLGLGMLIFLIMSVPMGVYLYKRRSRLLVPRGFGAWLLFLVWVVIGVGVLWADAPGAVPGGSMGRLLAFAWRIAWYVAATIVLLYVANLSDDELPADRVGRLLGYMFIVTTAGGLLGTFAPHLQLTSPLEMVLHTKNTFLLDAIHPKTAEVDTILGYEQARPMAPFAYANTWGAAYAFFLPFFVITWVWRAGTKRRIAGIVILLASLWPVVYSLDRGLWISLGVIACFSGLKMVARGGRRALRLAVAGLVVGGLVFAVSPLPGMIEARIHNPHSNNRRTLLAEQSVRSALTGSPIVGFGTTRQVQGNLSSLTGGDRPGCKACGAPPLGTQGHLWLLLFANGVVGTVAFGAFFLTRFARHWRERSAYGVAGCCVLLAFGLFLFIYDLVEVPLYTVMIAVALMWRARREADA
ncbi:DUF2852 domain-containing protein [Actinoallomurus sp. NBC_01490]|uniref:hypothetical protein n=1 Tax=Actinoallomurus sp. NBC_01490 TaxID=2903557 RepID=UPI002E2FFE5F|nr:hypothetical protein [Actinoallomurus sp. NBC_01490]